MENVETEVKIRVPVRMIFSSYWGVVRTYRWYFLATFGLYGAAVLLANVLPPLIYKNLVDIIVGAVSDPAGKDGVWMWLWILAGLRIGDFALFRFADMTLAVSQSRAIRDIAVFVFGDLQKHSYAFFSNRFSGSLVSQTRRFVEAFPTLQNTLIFSVWLNVVTLSGMLVSLSVFSVWLAAFFFAGMIGTIAVVWPLVKARWKHDETEAEEDTKVTGRFSDVITNILNVKMFSASHEESVSFLKFAERQKQARDRSWKAFIILSTAQNGLLALLQVLGLTFSVWLWHRGDISPGTVVLMQTYLLSVFHIAWDFTHSLSSILKSLANASEMVGILDLKQDVRDPERPEVCRIRNGDIRFNNVSFRYVDGDSVFDGFSLSVRAGEKVGLVGPSGGGKSTVTKLLLRFVDPQFGTIEIDGQDIRNIRQDDLRAKIAYVPQDPLLFHRSLRENIAYGRPDASEGDVIEASKRAHAHEFISRLPDGHETLVGERGIKLSGGQRQRVAIARAILKDAPILVLDEATSALDSESEHAIQEALVELMRDKTAIIIAHRLSTIRRMDRIVVVSEGGRIVEEGTHDSLIAVGGLYAGLWKRQTGGFVSQVLDEE